MKLWSRGLGRQELLMDFRYYKIRREPHSDSVQIIGTITDPVNWEFRIIFEPEDVPGLFRIALNLNMIKLVLKNLYKYPVYIFNRKKFKIEGYEDLEERVNKAYSQMVMRKRLPGD